MRARLLSADPVIHRLEGTKAQVRAAFSRSVRNGNSQYSNGLSS